MFPVCAVVAQSSIFAFHQSADVSCSVRSVGLRQPSYRLDLLNLLEKRDRRDLNHSQERRPGVYSEHITHALANAVWTFTNSDAFADVRCVRYECMEYTHHWPECVPKLQFQRRFQSA